jgi:hypothetical protein
MNRNIVTEKHSNYKPKFKLNGGGITYSFKEFFYNGKLFNESPNLINDISNNLDDRIYNSEQAEMVVNNFQLVGEIIDHQVKYLVYCDNIDNVIDYYLVWHNKGRHTIMAFLELECKHSGKDIYQIRSSWNNKHQGRGLFWLLFNEYVIHYYKTILSDDNFTKYARDFWEKLIINYNEVTTGKFSTFYCGRGLRDKTYIEYVNELPDDIYDTSNWLIGIEPKVYKYE